MIPGQKLRPTAEGLAAGWKGLETTHDFFYVGSIDSRSISVRVSGPYYNNTYGQPAKWFEPDHPDTPFYRDLRQYIDQELS